VQQSSTEIDVARLEQVLSEGGQLVDVREPQEYAAAHVPGALLVPMGRLTARLDELDASSPVHLICASGNRSGAMCDLLAARGFTAVNVAGGTAAWIASGRPVEGGLR
jgi:rhodanese-related sulfurtransferase